MVWLLRCKCVCLFMNWKVRNDWVGEYCAQIGQHEYTGSLHCPCSLVGQTALENMTKREDGKISKIISNNNRKTRSNSEISRVGIHWSSVGGVVWRVLGVVFVVLVGCTRRSNGHRAHARLWLRLRNRQRHRLRELLYLLHSLRLRRLQLLRHRRMLRRQLVLTRLQRSKYHKVLFIDIL